MTATGPANQSRLRHVKCDEGKPGCIRCSKAGRKCEGYAEALRKSRDQLTFVNYAAPASRSVSPFPRIDPREIRALEYFKACAAPELAGSFRTDLWHTFMLRLSHHQASVHNAIVAVATVHEAFTTSTSVPWDVSTYVDRMYGKAIRDVLTLNATTKGTSEATEVALATCVLFASLESIRGHYHSCLSHLMSGLNVLEEEQRQGRRGHDTFCIPRELLYALFMRMDSQRMDLGGAGSAQGAMLSVFMRPIIPPCFSSIEDARSQFDLLYHHIMQLAYRAEQYSGDPEFSRSSATWKGLLAQLQALEDIRLSWENALNLMLGRPANWRTRSPRAREPAVIVMDMSNIIISIILRVDMVNAELDYDLHEDSFDLAVSDAVEYLRLVSTHLPPPPTSRSSSVTPSEAYPPGPTFSRAASRSPIPLLPRPEPTNKPVFTLSIGCVPLLYLCAARCRTSSIRHRALALLRKCNRREALWDSNIAADIAERVIAIEEALTLQSVNDTRRSIGKHDDDMQEVTASQVLIPDESRVKYVDLKFGPENHGKVMYSMELPIRVVGSEVPSAMQTKGLGDLYEW